MCERLSDILGYICNECFEEMVASGTLSPKEFMERKKPMDYQSPDAEWYKKIFRKLDL